MSKSCFFIVQGLHGLSEEVTEDGLRVFTFRFGIPSVDLESELQKEFHVMHTCQGRRVYVECKNFILELLDAVS